jgi:hypothetical protein
MSPISSKNKVPFSAISIFPRLSRTAPPFGERRAVDGNEGLQAVVGVVVNGARHQLFSGPGFTTDENRGLTSGDHTDGLEHFAHLRRAADDVVDAPLSRGFGDQIVELGIHLLHSHRLANGQDQLVVVDGLADVLEGAELHRLHGRAHVVEGSDHHDVGFGIDGSDLLQDAEPVEAGEVDVQDDEIGLELLEPLHTLAAIGSEVDLETFLR